MLNLSNNSKEQQTKTMRREFRGMGSVIAILLTIGLVGASTWWVNGQLRAQGSSIAKLLGIQRDVDSLNQRMIGAETALSSFPAEVNKVNGRVDALDKRMVAVQKAAAKPVSAPVTAAVADLGKHVASLNEQIATLQTQHEADATQIEALRTELANAREQTSLQFASVKSEIPPDATMDVAMLKAAVDRNESGISSLADRMDRERHDFEIREDHVVELVPGVTLTVKDTNVSRQEISGWVYLENEHRVVFLKNHGLLQPITLYSVSGNQAHQIVITRVRKDDAIGFVLSPKTNVVLSAGN